MISQILIILSMMIGIAIGYRLAKDKQPIPSIVKTVENTIIKPVKKIKVNAKMSKEVKELNKRVQKIDDYQPKSQKKR